MIFFDPLYIVLVLLPGLVLAGGTSLLVKSRFSKYSKVQSSSGVTGAQAAHEMLREAGLGDVVGIERVSGFLSDHYDPRSKVLRLSPTVYDGRSVASLGVACHEAGHAVQHARKYAPLAVRNAIVPVAAFGSNLSWGAIFIGMIMMMMGMVAFGKMIALVGVVLFAAVVVFQIVNLPVEFDASSRAKKMLPKLGLISGPQESAAVSKVLGAAAMTYVAGTVTAMLTLLYFMIRLGLLGGRD
ncbi:zinc metallopeptidase [bacterium]|nr:zinc metallopeptidase [bacterium]